MVADGYELRVTRVEIKRLETIGWGKIKSFEDLEVWQRIEDGKGDDIFQIIEELSLSINNLITSTIKLKSFNKSQ